MLSHPISHSWPSLSTLPGSPRSPLLPPPSQLTGGGHLPYRNSGPAAIPGRVTSSHYFTPPDRWRRRGRRRAGAGAATLTTHSRASRPPEIAGRAAARSRIHQVAAAVSNRSSRGGPMGGRLPTPSGRSARSMAGRKVCPARVAAGGLGAGEGRQDLGSTVAVEGQISRRRCNWFQGRNLARLGPGVKDYGGRSKA